MPRHDCWIYSRHAIVTYVVRPETALHPVGGHPARVGKAYGPLRYSSPADLRRAYQAELAANRIEIEAHKPSRLTTDIAPASMPALIKAACALNATDMVAELRQFIESCSAGHRRRL
jgi:hypothetical protein